ncbi:tyrosinase family protein [Mucilaginibacter sabulilitoris]|uniref:Tyrosinase family protein n=1 Tax=Mucilaginibacter sabulilitoris TaxID=1173583 RepID=A0ABZ0THB2_9SPHI|nr:tyrosinase family protein [Mucilaginibacter sabulilitoris]WPU91623.1 tyrosinase family protein [Mucilaginibacter sabulilitoris]
MATFKRKNAWNQNGTFNNSDLLWYAKGVGLMQSRALNDKNSWWFFAAIHGYYLSGASSFPDWAHISGPPKVPSKPKPSDIVMKKYWDQCQHQTWYFPPWHRGYLMVLEKQVRAAIVKLGGPSTWALPYWNYFGPNDEYKIPPAFTQQTLPDGKPNPLFVKLRYGPQKNGNIYVPITSISQNCQRNTVYTGSNAATSLPGYGGPKTGFSTGAGTSGNLENDPHNEVHTAVGGIISNTDYGLMADPDTAALDPIFYLHHCNIDRMWASWNAAGNNNPADPAWLNGPTAVGDRKFVMPLPTGPDWFYTPNDVKSLSQLDYDYDNISTGIAPPLVSQLTQRLFKFGVNAIETQDQKNMDMGGDTELIGANEGKLQLKSSGARTTVKFDEGAWKKVPASLMKASIKSVPDRVYLQLENVKGNMDANRLTVSVNQILAGTISLFGLRKASKKESHHGGGLTFLLDITNIIDDLHLNNALSSESLDVLILPNNEVPEKAEITIGRVSLYREGQS